MPLTFDVCQLRDTGYSASANNSEGHKSVNISFTARYLVKVEGAANPNEISDLQVAYAPGIPLVNYHTYYHAASGLGFPLAVCSSKSVKRLSENGNVFHVDVTFATEPSKQGSGKEQEEAADADPVATPPPVDVTDIDPQVSYSLTSFETVEHTAPGYDQADVALDTPNVVSTQLLPSVNGQLGEQFNQPVTKKNANVSLTITQFEDTWSIDNLLDRGYKVNNAAWGTDAVVKAWMITNIAAVAQGVTMDVGGTATVVEKYRVTYTLERNDYTVKSSVGNLFVGHQSALPLYSRFYLDNNQEAVSFLSPKGMPIVGKVDATGAALADQSDPPHYVRFDTVDEIDFSFLQWEPGA